MRLSKDWKVDDQLSLIKLLSQKLPQDPNNPICFRIIQIGPQATLGQDRSPKLNTNSQNIVQV